MDLTGISRAVAGQFGQYPHTLTFTKGSRTWTVQCLVQDPFRTRKRDPADQAVVQSDPAITNPRILRLSPATAKFPTLGAEAPWMGGKLVLVRWGDDNVWTGNRIAACRYEV